MNECMSEYVFSFSILSDKTSHRSDLSPTWLQNEGFNGACGGTVAVHLARLTGINRGKTVFADFCKPHLVREKIQLILKAIYSYASNFIVRQSIPFVNNCRQKLYLLTFSRNLCFKVYINGLEHHLLIGTNFGNLHPTFIYYLKHFN